MEYGGQMAMNSVLAILDVLPTNIWLLILESLVSSRCFRLFSYKQSFILVEQQLDSLAAMLLNLSRVISLFSWIYCFWGRLVTKTYSWSPARQPKRMQALNCSPQTVVLRISLGDSSKQSTRMLSILVSSPKYMDLFSLTSMRWWVMIEYSRERKLTGISLKYSCSCFSKRTTFRFPDIICSSLPHTKFIFLTADYVNLPLSVSLSRKPSCMIVKAVTSFCSITARRQPNTTAFSRLLDAQRASISILPFSLARRAWRTLLRRVLSDTVLVSSREKILRHLRCSPSMRVLNCWLRDYSLRWPRASCWQKMRKLRTQ